MTQVTANQVSAKDGEAATEWLAGWLDARAAGLQQAWIERVRSEGALHHVSDEDLLCHAGQVQAIWLAGFTAAPLPELPADTWRALARRSVEESLAMLLTMRAVCREHLVAAADAGDDAARERLPVFERVADQVVAQAMSRCVAERERLLRDRMSALVGAGMLLTREEGLDRVLQKIVDVAREIVGAGYAALGVINDAGRLDRFVTSGLEGEGRRRVGHPPAGRGLLGVVLREPLRLDDVRQDPRATGFPPGHPGMVGFLGVPVMSRGHVYGNLYLTEKTGGGPFTEDDELLVTTFASQAAVAIENADSAENLLRLAESRRRQRQQAELLQRSIAVQEEERKRVARELHDHTGQWLTSLMIGLRRLESMQTLEEGRAAMAEMRQNANRALEEIHHITFELRPSVLDDMGIVVALQRYADDFEQRTGIHLEVELEALAGARLEPALEIALYRIVQEALTNVAKHSHAQTASVLLQSRADSLLLIVEDDGCGFVVPDASDTSGRHYGLMGMQERVNLIGGKLTIESSPGAGTTVFVELPQPARQEGSADAGRDQPVRAADHPPVV